MKLLKLLWDIFCTVCLLVVVVVGTITVLNILMTEPWRNG